MAHNNKQPLNCRLGMAGGQAVIEGVMMKSPKACAVAVRREDGTVSLTDIDFHSIREKHKIAGLPLIRGVVNFIEMMMLSYKTLSISAEAFGLDELEEESKTEKWMRSHLGKGIVDLIMGISAVLGVVLGLGLFLFLPTLFTKGIDHLAGGKLGWAKNLIEGLVKIAIFIGYMLLVSLMKDIRRTFEYHGAEHKTIFCYEAGEELIPENVRRFKRFHPRCGTSFLFVMLFLSILINSLPIVTWENMFLRVVTKFLLLPIIVGLGYEFIRYAGKHDNLFTHICSAPGLWMQRITTREPDDSQIEIAIIALKRALPDDFPGFALTAEQSGAAASEGSPDEATDEAPASDEPSDETTSADETADGKSPTDA